MMVDESLVFSRGAAFGVAALSSVAGGWSAAEGPVLPPKENPTGLPRLPPGEGVAPNVNPVAAGFEVEEDEKENVPPVARAAPPNKAAPGTAALSSAKWLSALIC